MNIERWRKRPVVVEAVPFTGFGPGGNGFEVMDWINNSGGQAHADTEGGSEIVVATLEGDHWGRIGDWVIRGIKGEFYPVKPDIFAATYERAE